MNSGLNSQASVASRIKDVAGSLSSWSKNVLGDLESHIKRAKVDLERCRYGNISRESIAREEVLRFKLDHLEEQLDIYWKQRAHVKWLEKGDRNTSFFHAVCSERRRRNKIGRLKNKYGDWVESEAGKETVITNYFLNLFRSSNALGAADQLLNAVAPRVTTEMNELLCSAFTREEVKDAVDSIGDLKAPGPDGMPSIFYKHCWDIVGDHVTDEVLDALMGADLPAGWNDTTIVLIPKVQNPEQVKDL